MGSRWSSIAVVVLWLAAMGWLVTQKVLPPLLVGEPPTYRTILEARQAKAPIGWHISLKDKSIGWARASIEELEGEMIEIHSEVRVTRLPVSEPYAELLQKFFALPMEVMPVECKTVVLIDSLKRLQKFDCGVWLSPLPHSGERRTRLARITGDAEGGRLTGNVVAGEGNADDHKLFELDLPQKSILVDAANPYAELPNLNTGMTWNVPYFNPLDLGGGVTMLEARVEGLEPFVYRDETLSVWLVLYRAQSGFGSLQKAVRGRAWVRQDGRVLRQQTRLLGAELNFDRMTDEEASKLAAETGKK